MKIQLAKKARNDLFAIEQYIQQDNPAAAGRTVLRVLEAIEYLVQFPAMGKVGRVLNTRELVISGTPFIAIYQVRHQMISVVRILHGARKWSEKIGVEASFGLLKASHTVSLKEIEAAICKRGANSKI